MTHSFLNRGATSLGAGMTLLVGLTACGGARATPPAAVSPGVIPTRVIVHVVTHDAKLIGSAVGGVRVRIRDATTGRELASALHLGPTGDTKRIMQDPRTRGDSLFAGREGARVEATLPLSVPTLVDIVAEGPLDYPDQLASTTKRLLLVPGRDVTGDGIVLEMHGYVLDVLAPDTTTAVPGGSEVRARVRMLCSCPTEPTGLWRVDELTARLWQGSTIVGSVPLAYAGEASTYRASLPRVPAGRYTLEIVAASPASATFGAVRRTITVR
jgi:hypothetical protein